MPPPPRSSSGIESQFAAATAHHQAGRLTEALAAYQRLRPLAPRDYRVLHLGGTALLQLGRAEEACPWLEAALRLLPKAAATHMCLGLALSQAGRNEPAEVHLRAAVRIEPANGESASNLGIFLVRVGQGADGLAALRRGAELRPGVGAGWLNLGGALLSLGHPAEALGVYERAIALAPRDPTGHRGRAMALHGCHRMAESLAAFDSALLLDPHDVTSASQRLLVLHYLDEFSAAQVAAAHRDFGQLAAALQPARVLPRTGGADKRLRVALLSPDLRTHAVAGFLEPLLGGLTADGFELVLYHDPAIEDTTSARLRGRAQLWRNFCGLPDAAVGRQILADAPDVLVDLAGHTGQNRQGLLASRLAPVQITYLGYPNTTGLTTMDFRLTDALADPPGEADGLHTERLVRFAPTAWCYGRASEAPEVVEPPCCAGAGVAPVFGSFNNLGKLSKSTWRLWARLLAAQPGARLLLKGTAPAADWLERQAAAVGLDPARVTLLPVVAGQAAHLGCYAQMDVALDAVPYNGTTTTCEALWMGRPVVTLVGDRHVSRVGASLLTAAGQGDCVTVNEEEFVARARALVADRAGLAARSARLRAELLASPLMDAVGQGRAFAQAIRECWVRGGG